MALRDKESHLTNYGYDFVLATTQASINSGLKAYLDETDQPIQYFCFLADEHGNPTIMISIEEIKQKTGINPFNIPHHTDYKDSRITTLTQARFQVGIKIQIGMPAGIEPKKLPPIVTLKDSASDVTFNLLCSELTIIQNTPGGPWTTGSWDVLTQPEGNPWYFETHTNLKMSDLDHNLNTPYLNSHPELQKQLKRQLSNISGTAFSLQQLLFDLDTATISGLPTIQGISKSDPAYIVLERSFINVYSKTAQEHGLPLVAITAVAQTTDPSSIELTSFERQVSRLKDSSGHVIDYPSPLQQSASTLDHLCATNGHTQQPARAFSWNWVETDEIDQESGVIAINRNTFAQYILDKILPLAKDCCFNVHCHVTSNPYLYETHLDSPQTPDHYGITPSGENVIHIDHKDSSADEAGWAGYRAELRVSPSYTCDVIFRGSTIILKQHSLVNMYIQRGFPGKTLNVVDKTVTNTFNLSVDSHGNLKIEKGSTETKDDSDSTDDVSGWYGEVTEMAGHFKDSMKDIGEEHMNIPLDQIPNFVFPGSKVFAYKSANFSENQDLLSAITYLDPTSSAPGASTGMAITHSTEMMQNYVQGEIVSPTSKFEGLQTDDGYSLLFAIDTSGVFHVIEEQSGTTSTGWQVKDLSTAVIQKHFPGKTGVVVRNFDVGQSALDGSINLTMAISCEGTDNLFVSLRNSSSNTAWTKSPIWTPIPFDATEPSQIVIWGILFAETTDKEEYLIVDIDRSTNSNAKDIVRYHIDFAKLTGKYWVKHDVPIDIEHGSYQSCIGRRAKARIDGVYTSGMAGGSPQLVYVPIKNVYNSPPQPVRLGLPGGSLPSAIATARYGDKGGLPSSHATTDLYVVGGSTLYRFAANEQHTDEMGKPVVTNSIISGTDTLLAMTHDGVTTLWGKNGSDQVYYLSCPTSQLPMPGSWSAPVPILDGIEHISAYINKADGGNTIFASGGGHLYKLMQATSTEAKVWRPQRIKLAKTPKEKALPFRSYTTTLHVIDTNSNDMPVGDTTVSVAADSRTPVYMNGLYYVLGQTPVSVKTDAAGSITIIQASEDLNGATLSVSTPGGLETYMINPMDSPFDRLASLDSEDLLLQAGFPAQTVAGGVVGHVDHSPLVDQSTPKSELKVIADHMSMLKEAYKSAKPSATSVSVLPLRDFGCASHVVPSTMHLAHCGTLDLSNSISTAIGDLFRWLKSGVEAVIKIVRDGVTKAWYFVAEIAGKVYSAVLKTIDAIVGAVEWVFNAIKTGIEKLIRFVEMLFEWDDIRRTKDVIHNVVKLYLENQVVDQLKTAKSEFDEQITEAEKQLRKWSGITDWSGLGDAAKKPASGNGENPSKGQTSQSLLFASHFRNNARDLEIIGGGDLSLDVQTLIDTLLAAISDKGEVLSTVYKELQELAGKFSSLNVADIIKALAAILAEGLLSSVKVVVDALLNALTALASSSIKLLDAKLHIPVISDILNLLGVPDISFLDLFAWIAAVGYTVVYKAVHSEAPFPDNAQVKGIISASSWDTLVKLLKDESETHGEVPGGMKKTIFVAFHATAGFVLFSCNFVNVFEAEAETGDNPFSIPSAVMGVVAAGMQGGADALVPVHPIENTAVSIFAKVVTVAVVTNKIIFSGVVQKKLAVTSTKFRGMAVNDGRATGSIIDAILTIPALFVSGWHFYELSQKPQDKDRSAAIVGEVSNVTACISRVSYAVAVNDKDPSSKQIPIAVMALSNVASSGLQTAEAFLA